MDRLSTIEMGRRIVRNEGIGGLYRGLTPSLVGASTSWGLYFFFYERAKKRRQYDQDVTQLGMGYHMACACEAGVMTTFMTNPSWLVKTRLQLGSDPSRSTGGFVTSKANYRGTFHALSSIIRAEGVRGLYAGMGSCLLLDCSYSAVQVRRSYTHTHIRVLV